MHGNTKTLTAVATGIPSTNGKTPFWCDYADDKIGFSLSLLLHISFVQDIHTSLRDLIHTLGHTWVDSRRKEVFNPILPARWHCCGKLLFFFCMGKIKASGLILPLPVRIKVTHTPGTLGNIKVNGTSIWSPKETTCQLTHLNNQLLQKLKKKIKSNRYSI